MRRVVLWLSLSTVVLVGCTPDDAPLVQGGDARRGRDALLSYECDVCHVIPGIGGTRGQVGPPLTDFPRRVYLGGQLPNTPEVLVRWIMDPPSLVADTAMPNVGVSEAQARDMAAYLYGRSDVNRMDDAGRSSRDDPGQSK